MKLCQLASGQSFSVTRHAETGFKALNPKVPKFETLFYTLNHEP